MLVLQTYVYEVTETIDDPYFVARAFHDVITATTKKFAHVGVFLGHLLSQNRVPKLSDPGPPQ